MIVKLVVIQSVGVNTCERWVTNAWDEYTIDENPDGFTAAVECAEAEHGAANVRILNVRIPEGSLDKPFEVPTVEGEVKP